MSDLRKVVLTLIDRTKSEEITWKSIARKQALELRDGSDVEQAYYAPLKDGQFFVVWVYAEVYTPDDGDTWIKGQYPALAITDQFFSKLYEFNEEDNLDNVQLWRLIRLIQRRVHNIDTLLDDFLGSNPDSK